MQVQQCGDGLCMSTATHATAPALASAARPLKLAIFVQETEHFRQRKLGQFVCAAARVQTGLL
jgi:hypothetical protein